MPVWEIRDLLVKVTIHRTDTVSVVIGCSFNPIVLDINGIIRLTNTLSIVEDRMSRLVEGLCLDKAPILVGDTVNPLGDVYRHHHKISEIPPHSRWIVTMWHFGADGSMEYGGEKFHIAYTDAEGILTRIYSKQMKDGKVIIRPEIQELPNKEFHAAVQEKLNSNK